LLFLWDMHGRRRRPQRGFSILELLIVAVIVSIAAGAAMPRREQGLFALHNAQSGLVADMRMTRGSAIAQGVHFRLDITDSRNYAIHKMMDSGGGWVEDGDPVVERELPPTVSFSGGIGEGYEFNTRGFLVDPTVLQTLTLVDSATGGYRTVDVWPSGQVISG
jgi:prepilin-type N-terminal cleavage/methylation domain-containing protein